MEPEEPVPLEEEGEQPKAARRKQKRPRKDSAPLVEAMEEKLRVTEFVVEALPLPGVLMVEVDNVLHEEFQVTEEVKVSLTLAQVSSDLECSVFFLNFEWFCSVFLLFYFYFILYYYRDNAY